MKEKIFGYIFNSLFLLYSFFLPISYNFANAILTFLCLFFIIYLILKRKFFKSDLYIPFFLLFLTFLLSSFLGYNQKVSLREITIFKGFLMMIFTMNIFPKEKNFFNLCIFSFLLATFINVSYSILEKVKQLNPLYRIEALWGHYQFFADFLVIAFFTELFYFTFVRRIEIKLGIFLFSILTFFSLILTASRAQIIFSLLGIFMFLFFYRKKIAIILSIVFILILIFSFLKVSVFYTRIKPLFLKEGKFGLYPSQIEELNERMETWKNGLKILNTKYKFFGVGLGNSVDFVKRELGLWINLNNMHNSFVEILASFGIFGFLVFIYFLLIYFKKIYESMVIFKGSWIYYYGLSVFISSIIILIFVGFLNDTFWNKRVMMQLFYFSGILFAFKRDENSFSI